MENSKEDDRGYTQKLMILKVIQKILCEILIGGKTLLTVICFLKSLISGQMFKMILHILKGTSQEMCYINGNGEIKLFTVSANIKEFLGIVEIDNKKCHICSKFKTKFELVTDKLIMSLDGLHIFNLPRQIYQSKLTILANDTVVLDVIFQNYFQESLLEDFICENCSSGRSESTKLTFTISRYLKEPLQF